MDEAKRVLPTAHLRALSAWSTGELRQRMTGEVDVRPRAGALHASENTVDDFEVWTEKHPPPGTPAAARVERSKKKEA